MTTKIRVNPQVLPPAFDVSDELMTVQESALFLKVSNSTIYNFMRDGRIKAFYVGNMRRRIPKSELLRLLGGEVLPAPLISESTSGDRRNG